MWVGLAAMMRFIEGVSATRLPERECADAFLNGASALIRLRFGALWPTCGAEAEKALRRSAMEGPDAL